MAFFRWGHSWSPLHDLEREVDRFLRGVNLSIHGIRTGRQFPLINIYELEEEYLLTSEIPGNAVSELELTVESGRLTLKGNRNDVKEIPEESFRRQERFRGNWQRTVALPDRVIEDELRAEFNNGVLKIHLPKAKQAEPRKIQIVEQLPANPHPANPLPSNPSGGSVPKGMIEVTEEKE